MEIAAPIPSWCPGMAVRYESNGSVIVALFGPPPVRMMIWVRFAEVQIVESIAVTNRTGWRLGRVMYQYFWTVPAPSISAASYSSWLIACIPAIRFMVQNGVPAQITTSARAGNASLASLKVVRDVQAIVRPLVEKNGNTLV